MSNLLDHYSRFFGKLVERRSFDGGSGVLYPCEILCFDGGPVSSAYTYVTFAEAADHSTKRVEFFLLSPVLTNSHVELLAAIAYFHQKEVGLGIGDSVYFGRPWLPESVCDFGLVSLPYMFGPDLEMFQVSTGIVQTLWIVPISRSERDFKAAQGVESLEAAFEASKFNYMDPLREPVV